MKKIHLIGKKFGNLTVISAARNRWYGSTKFYRWLCQCTCGKLKIITTSRLSRKKKPAHSCGCLNYLVNHGNRKRDLPATSYHALINRYVQTAKGREIKWDLSDDDAIQLFTNNCYYCGIEPSNRYNVYISKSGTYRVNNPDWAAQAWVKYNGIDRIDSNL